MGVFEIFLTVWVAGILFVSSSKSLEDYHARSSALGCKKEEVCFAEETNVSTRIEKKVWQKEL